MQRTSGSCGPSAEPTSQAERRHLAQSDSGSFHSWVRPAVHLQKTQTEKVHLWRERFQEAWGFPKTGLYVCFPVAQALTTELHVWIGSDPSHPASQKWLIQVQTPAAEQLCIRLCHHQRYPSGLPGSSYQPTGRGRRGKPALLHPWPFRRNQDRYQETWRGRRGSTQGGGAWKEAVPAKISTSTAEECDSVTHPCSHAGNWDMTCMCLQWAACHCLSSLNLLWAFSTGERTAN